MITNLKSTAFLAGITATTLGLTTGVAQAISITPTNSGSDLVNTILGSGVTISNINYSGANGASGIFTGGLSSGIDIDSGILLTSGQASSAAGPNKADGTTTNNGFGGDSDLNSLIPGYSTYDATVLEFDFVADGGDLFFNFAFGSEEYNEYVNSSFNDVFGFFVDGVNIALLPDGTTPVAINNVNKGLNSADYNDNDYGDFGGSSPFKIEYDGFTSVLTAKSLGLSAGKHHIKLAIADAGDSILDSGVFIQAGSFANKPTDPEKTPEPASIFGLLTVGAVGLTSLKRKQQNA